MAVTQSDSKPLIWFVGANIRLRLLESDLQVSDLSHLHHNAAKIQLPSKKEFPSLMSNHSNPLPLGQFDRKVCGAADSEKLFQEPRQINGAWGNPTLKSNSAR